jgi:hypothetical protein
MTTQQQLMEQLVELTEAVKNLAERPVRPPAVIVDVDVDADDTPAQTEADRVQQRVAFSYRALGTLTGRVSTASGREFDVRVVRARPVGDLIEFDGLPPGAEWVELRSGARVESLRISRTDDGPDRGVVRPQLFGGPDHPIGSMVFLRSRRGPLIAFGPRLPARSTVSTDLDPA